MAPEPVWRRLFWIIILQYTTAFSVFPICTDDNVTLTTTPTTSTINGKYWLDKMYTESAIIRIIGHFWLQKVWIWPFEAFFPCQKSS